MGSLVIAAAALADAVKNPLGDPPVAGPPAFVDPAEANNNRPCVLIAPPAIDYVQRLNTWRVVCLSSKAIGTLDALVELDKLVQAVTARLDVERADVASYVLDPTAGPVPAYILTVTTC